MLPACRTQGEGFAIPTFDVAPSDVEGFMEELWEFQSTFHDCFARGEPRAHFFDSMVGQFSTLERKAIEPMALQVEGGTIRGLQRFISGLILDSRVLCDQELDERTQQRFASLSDSVDLAPPGRTLLISDVPDVFPTASSYPQVCQHELYHGLCPIPVSSSSWRAPSARTIPPPLSA